MRWSALSSAVFVFLLTWANSAQAQIPSPSSLIPNGIATELVRDLGMAVDLRPYEPATPLAAAGGIDLGLQVILSEVPPTFFTAFTDAGQTAPPLPFFPMAALTAHKGLGDVDIGGSWLGYLSYNVWEADAKLAFINSEEGPTWALRLCYTSANLVLNASGLPLTVTTTTWHPQLIVSRKLEFADPYMGVGYEFVTGGVSTTVQTGAPPPFPATVSASKTGSGGAYIAFIGVGLRVPRLGLKLTIDGAYNSVGANSLGTKVGFNF